MIPNTGERRGKLGFENGILAQTCFQEGKVRKPLLAVSDVEDKGNITIFSSEGSVVAPMTDPAVQKILKLMKEIKTAIKVHRVNNTYRIPAWTQADDVEAPVFSRQPQR